MLRLLRVLGDPIFRNLVESGAVVLVLLSYASLYGVVWLRRLENRSYELEDVLDFVWRLPLVRSQHAQAHGAFVVVRHVRVVDLSAEGDGRRLEGVLWEECQSKKTR